MENPSNANQSIRADAIAALLAIGAGSGLGYAIFLATGSNVLGIVMAGAIGYLVNNFIRSRLRKGDR